MINLHFASCTNKIHIGAKVFTVATFNPLMPGGNKKFTHMCDPFVTAKHQKVKIATVKTFAPMCILLVQLALINVFYSLIIERYTYYKNL